jgi:RimJ/RimL family protein N-acetyltransferase
MNWLASTTFQGEYVTLVPLSMGHCSALVEAAKEGDLWKLWYATVPTPEDKDAMVNEIQRRLNLQEQGIMLPFTVIDNKTNQPIGMTTYCNIDAANKRLEIGWTWYRKSMQRTAANTESKLMLLTHAFEVLQCIAVEFRTNFFNQTSREAIERLGAKFDGLLRNHRIMRNGLIGDTCVYSIISTEWPSVKMNLLMKIRSHQG